MMKMKKLLLLFCMVSLSFAAGSWQELSATAIMIAVMILGLIFVLGYITDNDQLKFLAKEEFVQVVVTAVMVALFASIIYPFSSMHNDAIAAINETLATLNSMNDILGNAAVQLGKEGSKSTWCSFSVVSFGVNVCFGQKIVGSSFSSAFQLITAAYAELSGIRILIEFARNWLIFLFPLGIFLRTFKYTRGAGCLLISLGVATYVVLPLTYLFVHETTTHFAAAQGLNAIQGINVGTCDEYAIQGSRNENVAIETFRSIRDNALNVLLFYVLVKATLTTLVSLGVMVVSIRYLLAIAGVEVNVQSLGKMI